MVKITLRSYIREIENLIDQNQTEEAIAHCKHLLKLFPKYIDAYRMLGKAYLESQRYKEASDVLSRVLSVLPDDFIAHIGMSLVREDEGNLDGAIWHMERAFDVQPSNQAISDELRRLFGRRDGIEPPKIRLTKGALVRMYLRGELFPQAIAEAQSALLEDPKRVDIQVALLRAYHQAQFIVEAINLAQDVISDLPNNYDANFVLSDLLNTPEKHEEAIFYRQSVISLNPYTAYLNEQIKTPENVPDSAVTVDRIEWSPGIEQASKPEWAQFFEEDKQVLKDISPPLSTGVNSLTSETQNQSNFIGETAINLQVSNVPEISEDNQPYESPNQKIPEWMAAAGWNKSEAIPAREGDNLELDHSNDLEAAEIPSWLQALAPISEEQNDNISNSSEEDHKLEELLAGSEIFPVPTDNHIQSDTNISPDIQLPDIPEVSGWSPNTESSESSHSITPNDPVIPEWLGELSKTDAPAAQDEKIEPDFPDWLKEMEKDQSENPVDTIITNTDEQNPIPADIDSSMAWLDTLSDKTHVSTSETTLPEDQPKQPANWMGIGTEESSGFDQIQTLLHPNDEKPSPAEEDAAFAWLESLAARHGADEGSLLSPEEDRLVAPPDWVQKVPPQPEVFPTTKLDGTESIPEDGNHLEKNPSISEDHDNTISNEDIMENHQQVISNDEEEDQIPASGTIKETIPEWMDTTIHVEQSDEKEDVEVTSWLDTLNQNGESFIPESISSRSSIDESIPTNQPKVETASDLISTLAKVSPTGITPIFNNVIQETIIEPVHLSEDQTLADQPVEEDDLTAQKKTEEFISTVESSESAVISGKPSEQSENDPDVVLSKIRKQLQGGEITTAIDTYNTLISKTKHLDEIIRDLRDALYQYPIDISIWQTLGDACARNNQIQDALDAYTKAEELLH
jgi:tetratricopeptide (TPR) repeat protein